MSRGVEWEPTEEQRRSIRAMAGYGVSQEDIAQVLKVDPKTLRKHCRDDLDGGIATANVNVGRSLYELAIGRPAQYDEAGNQIREELKPDKAAAIFSAKARLGMRETKRLEHSGPDGGPIHTTELDLSVFTDEELTLFMQLYEKARRRAREAEVGGPPEPA